MQQNEKQELILQLQNTLAEKEKKIVSIGQELVIFEYQKNMIVIDSIPNKGGDDREGEAVIRGK